MQFENAIALHQQGLLNEAETIYREILSAQPTHCGALHLLGVLATQNGNRQLAADLIGKAITLCPDDAAFYSNRGIALKQLQQPEAAVSSYDRAIAIKPDYVEAHYNRGMALQELKQFDAAVASFDRAIALRTDYAEAYSNRGIALTELKQFDAAVASYDRAIAFKADYAIAHSNRGVALQALKRLDDAAASYALAIALKPDHAEAYSNRGATLQELKRLDAAVASHDRAIALRPDYAEAHYNRGIALQLLKRLEAAVASYCWAIAIEPDYAEACSNLGMALEELKQLDAAVTSYDRALALQPDYAEVYWNKALVHLLRGDFDTGWKLYEWRWAGTETGRKNKRRFTQPLWLGNEPIRGKTMLLHAEQGFGDTLQFCRYARLVAALGARVILEVPVPLLGLLGELEGASALIERGTPLPPFDCHCPLLSLPLAFKTGRANIPASQAYLRSDPGKVSVWADRLGSKTKPRVGLAWSGSDTHRNDQNRSVALSSLLPYLPDACEYVSLQKDVRDIDRAALAQGKVRHFGEELRDFTDTAALCALMDAVISVDTSVAHLSAALGGPTWILLPFVPDWRWLLDRDDSPWYPSVKLYRQEASRDWAGVLERVGADLAGMFPGHEKLTS